MLFILGEAVFLNSIGYKVLSCSIIKSISFGLYHGRNKNKHPFHYANSSLKFQ
jgi:hypothetical protein